MYFQPNKITWMNVQCLLHYYWKDFDEKKSDTFLIIFIGSNKQKPLTLILTFI